MTESGKVIAARFCQRCGKEFGRAQIACSRCGAKRRLTRPVARQQTRNTVKAAPQWVWCHFFRNAFIIGVVVCFFLANSNREPEAFGACAVVFGAMAIIAHLYHANVCLKGKKR